MLLHERGIDISHGLCQRKLGCEGQGGELALPAMSEETDLNRVGRFRSICG